MKIKNLYADMALFDKKKGDKVLVKKGEIKEGDFIEERIKELVKVGKLEIIKSRVKKVKEKGE